MAKVIIVTGASSGVGLALGNYFHDKGYKVFGLSRSVSENAKFETISTDITKEEEVEKAMATISSKTERIDLLVNNAGMGMVGAVEDATADEITKIYNLNVIGLVLVTKKVVGFMRERNNGRVINISSLASIMGLPFRGFYSASKASVDMITEAMRYELKNTDIQICTLNLGDVKTNIAEGRVRSEVSAVYKNTFEKVYEEMNRGVENGSNVEDVARYIDRLLNKKSKLKPHYYFGSFVQKLSLFAKSTLPQKCFEWMISKYSGM